MTGDFLYNQSAALIVVLFLVLLLLVGEASYRLGRRARPGAGQSVIAQLGTFQGAVLALLGLLFAFTFSMAVSRYDARKQAVVKEANAVGTAALRARLLPSPYSVETSHLFRQYVGVRVEEAEAGFNRVKAKELDQKADQLQEQLWAQAVAASEKDPYAVSTAAYINALNDAIDAKTDREAALGNHVPESVIFLLLGASVLSLGVVGYTLGLEGGRSLLAMTALSALIALVGWVILDLDRPYRGLIRVDQQTMIDLQESLKRKSESR